MSWPNESPHRHQSTLVFEGLLVLFIPPVPDLQRVELFATKPLGLIHSRIELDTWIENRESFWIHWWQACEVAFGFRSSPRGVYHRTLWFGPSSSFYCLSICIFLFSSGIYPWWSLSQCSPRSTVVLETPCGSVSYRHCSIYHHRLPRCACPSPGMSTGIQYWRLKRNSATSVYNTTAGRSCFS